MNPAKVERDRVHRLAQGRVLVITPNLEFRRGISTAFDVAWRECFWTSTRVLTRIERARRVIDAATHATTRSMMIREDSVSYGGEKP